MINDYEIRGNVTAIFIKHKRKIIETLVDTEDLYKVKPFRWVWLCNGYVHLQKFDKGPQTKLHRLIMNTPKGLVADHINHNKLDNMKSNLRNVTQAQNARNRRVSKNNKHSKFRGVCWDSKRNKWRAYSKLNGKIVGLGRFDCDKHAQKVVLEFRKKHAL
jgi:hypothetical protein